MNFYKQVVDSRKEFEYFIYMIEQVNTLELEYKKIINERDSKLKLILLSEFDKANTHFLYCFENFKSEINNMALNKLEVKQLEELAQKINDFVNQINCVFNQIDLVEISINI